MEKAKNIFKKIPCVALPSLSVTGRVFFCARPKRRTSPEHSQHQRSQHRLKGRPKWHGAARRRLTKTEVTYAENFRKSDAATHVYTEKGKERIRLEFAVDGHIMYEKDKGKIMDALRGGMKAVTREQSKRALIGSYRGFEVTMHCSLLASTADGFRSILNGVGEQEFQPDNLVYSFDEKFSLSGFFQRMDNFLEKGPMQALETYRANVGRELANWIR